MNWVTGLLVALALAGFALAATSCQSTQATSAEREAAGKKLLGSEKGLTVTKTNPDIKVLDTSVIADKNGTAVVVELKNESDQAFANVPIAIDVRDSKGKSVFKNNLAGLDPALVSAPLIGPGETFDWVNNQVLATGEPDSVKVKVGASDTPPITSEIPKIQVDDPELKTDQFTGVEAVGTAENESPVEQENLTFFAVARKGNEVVAAGRAVLKRLQPNAEKKGTYHVFFTGDPQGADVTVTAPPTVLR